MTAIHTLVCLPVSASSGPDPSASTAIPAPNLSGRQSLEQNNSIQMATVLRRRQLGESVKAKCKRRANLACAERLSTSCMSHARVHMTCHRQRRIMPGTDGGRWNRREVVLLETSKARRGDTLFVLHTGLPYELAVGCTERQGRTNHMAWISGTGLDKAALTPKIESG